MKPYEPVVLRNETGATHLFGARSELTFEEQLRCREDAWRWMMQHKQRLPFGIAPPRPVSPLTRHDEKSLAYARRHPSRWYRMTPEMMHRLASEVQP